MQIRQRCAGCMEGEQPHVCADTHFHHAWRSKSVHAVHIKQSSLVLGFMSRQVVIGQSSGIPYLGGMLPLERLLAHHCFGSLAPSGSAVSNTRLHVSSIESPNAQQRIRAAYCWHDCLDEVTVMSLLKHLNPGRPGNIGASKALGSPGRLHQALLEACCCCQTGTPAHTAPNTMAAQPAWSGGKQARDL